MPAYNYHLPMPKPDPMKKRISAAALSYQAEKDQAPRLVAKGQGIVAEQIISLAKEHQIPVYDDPVLVNALSTLDIGDEIPQELYRIVAEVLAYIYRVAGKLR